MLPNASKPSQTLPNPPTPPSPHKPSQTLPNLLKRSQPFPQPSKPPKPAQTFPNPANPLKPSQNLPKPFQTLPPPPPGADKMKKQRSNHVMQMLIWQVMPEAADSAFEDGSWQGMRLVGVRPIDECIFRCRYSMNMWCLEDIGRDIWVWVLQKSLFLNAFPRVG